MDTTGELLILREVNANVTLQELLPAHHEAPGKGAGGEQNTSQVR
jgi:hypothetical protein